MPLTSSAIDTWVSLLSGGGLLRSEREAAGALLAARVVGEARLAELRDYLEARSEAELAAIRSSAIELCIWMMVADRVIVPAERDLLVELVRTGELGASDERRAKELLQQALGDIRTLPHPETLAARLDHPVLRALMRALASYVAEADGFVDALEGASFSRLCGIFGVESAVAARLRQALAGPPP